MQVWVSESGRRHCRLGVACGPVVWEGRKHDVTGGAKGSGTGFARDCRRANDGQGHRVKWLRRAGGACAHSRVPSIARDCSLFPATARHASRKLHCKSAVATPANGGRSLLQKKFRAHIGCCHSASSSCSSSWVDLAFPASGFRHRSRLRMIGFPLKDWLHRQTQWDCIGRPSASSQHAHSRVQSVARTAVS